MDNEITIKAYEDEHGMKWFAGCSNPALIKVSRVSEEDAMRLIKVAIQRDQEATQRAQERKELS